MRGSGWQDKDIRELIQKKLKHESLTEEVRDYTKEYKRANLAVKRGKGKMREEQRKDIRTVYYMKGKVMRQFLRQEWELKFGKQHRRIVKQHK